MTESRRRMLVLLVLTVLLSCGGAEQEDRRFAYDSHPAPIVVDGEITDWASVPLRHNDVGDGTGMTLERLRVAHDNNHLFLRIEVGRPISLQQRHRLTLHLDTDDDPSTGTDTLGLGADVSWTFGQRSGTVGGTAVGHAALGLHVLPTVRAEVFEMALDRGAQSDGSALFPGDRMRVAWSTTGDRLPDAAGGVGYAFTDTARIADTPTLDRPAAADLRLLSYNVKNDFERDRAAFSGPGRRASYRRILTAVRPDVVALQEVYNQTAAELGRAAEESLGLPTDWSWAKRGPDLVLGSRFPIEDTHAIAGFRQYESGAFLLNARAVWGRPLLVVVMHPPCCNDPATEDAPSRNVQRQRVVDGVAAFLRRVTRGAGPFEVPSGTPIMIVGDMNFVGDPQQPRTLRTGAIVDTTMSGPGAPPDWDDTPLLDVNPRQTGAPLHTTWTDPGSSFVPGRLDYAFVSDSVAEVVHAFVLRTSTLSDAQRAAHNLRAEDTRVASDHLPVVVDLAAP
ncbi:MAG: endonuclease [Bacteroidetes bacterium SW_9_63_38]|nr:MAG: endonuclease [Bacteroidetes bacterium SW_9_63_38]